VTPGAEVRRTRLTLCPRCGALIADGRRCGWCTRAGSRPLANGANGASRRRRTALREGARVTGADGPLEGVQRPSEAVEVRA
jgi:hypothetical protein